MPHRLFFFPTLTPHSNCWVHSRGGVSPFRFRMDYSSLSGSMIGDDRARHSFTLSRPIQLSSQFGYAEMYFRRVCVCIFICRSSCRLSCSQRSFCRYKRLVPSLRGQIKTQPNPFRITLLDGWSPTTILRSISREFVTCSKHARECNRLSALPASAVSTLVILSSTFGPAP